ncbi:MAG: J domain-containing protein [Dehalococcoidia bacterium]|nr:J domain-containing protein [Dehalococcoidia bacterium]
MAQDYYQTLGVAHTASDKEIRAAYRRLARRFHPDVNPGNADAERRFKEVNAAHEVLSDRGKRKKYDRHGDQWEHADQIEEMQRRQQAAGGFGGVPRGGFPGGGPGGATFSFGGEGIDLGDILGGARGAGGGMFDSLLRRASGRQRGRDVEQLVRVTLAEAYAGATRTIEVRAGEERCMVCGGAGQLAGATCHACRGSGSATPLQRFEVTIPAGVQDGQRIRVAGKGGPGAAGGAAGDLFLKVEVAPDERFERRGDDLRVDIDVPVADAALGGEVQVPTLKGRHLALRIPAGTQGGKVFRAAGQGMPKVGGGFGDLFATVHLVLPEPLTEEQRRLFEQLRAAQPSAARADAANGGAR